MADNTFETSVVSFLNKFPELFRQRGESLEEFNQILNNEYTTLVEQSLVGLDYLPGILEKIQILLAANQLTAISILVGIPEVDILGTLDKISTKRSPIDTAISSGFKLSKMVRGESRRDLRLPSYDSLALAVGESRRGGPRGGYFQGANSKYDDYSSTGDNSRNTNNQYNTDNTRTDNRVYNSDNSRTDNTTINNYESGEKKPKVVTTLPPNFAKMLAEQEGLSQGKLFSCTFERNGNKLEVPMRVRLDVKNVSSDIMATLMVFSEQARDSWERYIRLQHKPGRNGSFIDKIKAAKDIAFSNDLVDEYRKNRYRDKSGYYTKMMEKKNANWLSGLLSFSPSINNASGVMVVSQDTVDSIEAELGGSFDDFAVRQRVFKDTLTVYYVVIDTAWNNVTIYTRGMNGQMSLDKNDFTKSKSGSADVNKIIEAYRSGAQPIL